MNLPVSVQAPHARLLDVVCGFPVALATWALWLALGLGYLGQKWWVFDLFANFRVQYMGAFALCVVLLTVARWRKSAIVALLGVAFTTATMAPYFQERVSASVPAQAFRVLTFNTWFRNDRMEKTVAFLLSSNADVVILQEVTATNVDSLARMLSSYPHRTFTPGARHGLAIFSRWPLRAEHLEVEPRMTRIARVEVDWQGTSLTIFAAHLNWPLGPRTANARKRELQTLAANVRTESKPVIVAGDFNLTPWSRHFDQFIADSGVADCAIGQGLLATWPSQVLPARIRIDHCFVSAHWHVHRVEVGPRLGSDHLPVIVDLELLRGVER